MPRVWLKATITGDLHCHNKRRHWPQLIQKRPIMKHLPQVHTQFLSAQDVAAIVPAGGVAAPRAGRAAYTPADYRRWQDFDKGARVASHSVGGVIELMPISDAKTYAFKYVNGHPKNTLVGLPTVMAFGVLADVATGIPVLQIGRAHV